MNDTTQMARALCSALAIHADKLIAKHVPSHGRDFTSNRSQAKQRLREIPSGLIDGRARPGTPIDFDAAIDAEPSLNERERRVLALRVAGWKLPEIARKTGFASPKSVSQMLRRIGVRWSRGAFHGLRDACAIADCWMSTTR